MKIAIIICLIGAMTDITVHGKKIDMHSLFALIGLILFTIKY